MRLRSFSNLISFSTRRLPGKRRGGFTLIELLIVLLIIAVLAGIAVMSLTGSDEGAIIASMLSDARNAITAENAYYMAYKRYLGLTVTAPDTEPAASPIGSSEIKVVASPGNQVNISPTDCGDGVTGSAFTVSVTNSKTQKQVVYDSCRDAAPKIVDGS